MKESTPLQSIPQLPFSILEAKFGGDIRQIIEPGSPWENGYVESFIRKLRDELLNREILYTVRETKVVVERWRRDYN